ncbi:hypothetical protein KDW_48380 [Dictyobacter vulcani]|uniref:histidine kinase n=1 Tax=Dictyobacter vulcani TaxID=2607529 RepID=A0A5J4KZM9_9CHLR|nr:HAMP domain-containing sensor histidine kinase [Dictyobacter vulcani]GER90676.1 hypothetical protein KDW_48380 [Dictyobacter vulcani]
MKEMHKRPGQPATEQLPGDTTFMNAEWLASLSHELRNPLAAIKGYTTLLLRHHGQLSSEEQYELLQSIAHGSDQLAYVINMLQEVADFEANLVAFRPLSIDINQLVHEVVMDMQRDDQPAGIAHRAIQISLIPPTNETEEYNIAADQLLLRSLFIYLLENAHKFSPEQNPIEITITHVSTVARETLPEYLHADPTFLQQPLLELRIQDRGIGIPAEDLERIFERFQRVNLTLTREVNGLGLGLTLCKYIVALHHGLIWAESTLGTGSTFHVLLPGKRNTMEKDTLQ